MESDILIALSTFPEVDTARRIARQLVSEKLVACANLLPAVESIYRWQEKIEDASETLVLFKTTRANYSELQDRLEALHPYDVPELVCLNVTNGLPDYLRWVTENTGR